MKTKTAEALMYGKTIIGTKEAFEGYVLDEKAMKLCSNAQEFIDTALCLIKIMNVQYLILTHVTCTRRFIRKKLFRIC